MSNDSGRDQAGIDLDQLDTLCDRFEAVWLLGERPKLTEFVNDVDPASKPLLLEYLLEIDLDYRARSGETPEAGDYLADFGDYSAVVRRALEEAGSRGKANDVTVDLDRSPSPRAGQQLQVGAELGGYELLAELGRGGMGVVFKAKQIALNRIVALKTIKHADAADDQLIRRFQAEAETAAKINHEGIVPVFDVGKAGGIHFFSMQLVEGDSLSQLVTDGPLDPGHAAALARDISVAMQSAHANGLIHRDLKPANVLLDRNGQPKITDFGLAKLVSGDSNLTVTGQILGTPSYMPPEQASGDSEQVDELSDLYSIGATLYHLLTGVPPFRSANPVETLRQVMEKEPVSPRQLNPAISVDLETICLKAMQKERAKRYASAAELAADLDRWLAGQPILARPIGPAGRMVRWCRRQPVVAGLVAAVAVSLLVGTIVSTNYAIEADFRAGEAQRKEQLATRLKGEAEEAKSRAEEARESEESQRIETEEQLYWTTIQLAAERLETGRETDVATMLWQTPRHLRGWEWGWLMAQCQHPRWVISAHEGSLRDLSVTADGQQMVTIGDDRSIALWNLATRELIWRVTEDHSFERVVIDPQGEFVAASHSDGIQIYRASDGRFLRTLSTPEFHLLAVSPDGKTLYHCKHGVKDTLNRPFTAWNTADWTIKHQADNPGGVGAIAVDMAGKYVVTGSGNYPSKTVIYQADTLKRVDTVDMYWRIESIAFDSRRGMFASTLRNDLQLFRWKNNDADRHELGKVSDTVTMSVVYHRPLDRFVAAALDGTVTVHRPDASRQGKLQHGDSVAGMAALGDSMLLTGGRSGMVKCWDLATVLDRQRFSGLTSRKTRGASNIAISHNGKLLAYCGYSEDYHKFHVADLSTTRQAMYEQTISHKKLRFGKFIPGTSHFCFVTPGEIQIHDASVRPWQLVRTIPCRDGRQYSIDIDREGKRLLLAYRESVGADTFDLATGKALPAAPLTGTGLSQIRADGKLAVMQRKSGDGADVWNVETGGPITRIANGVECKSATLHPTEAIAAIGLRNGDVLIWDIAADMQVRRLAGHDIWVTNLRFSPDGDRLFTASQDHTVRVWNWRIGKAYVTLNHSNGIYGLDLTPDGRTLATTATDPHANIREVPSWDVGFYEQSFLDEMHDMRVRDQARLLLLDDYGSDKSYETIRSAVESRDDVSAEVKALALELAEDWKD